LTSHQRPDSTDDLPLDFSQKGVNWASSCEVDSLFIWSALPFRLDLVECGDARVTPIRSTWLPKRSTSPATSLVLRELALRVIKKSKLTIGIDSVGAAALHQAARRDVCCTAQA
jgi:hypothetical protein